jgi:lysozyme
MDLSEDGRTCIQSEEKLALIPYKDGGGVWTWGYGHAQGPHETVPDQIDEDEANSLLDKDTAWAVKDVNHILQSDVPQNIFDALVSFLFNIGLSELRALPHRTLDAIIAQDWPLVGKLMMNWVHDNGKFVQGLYNRRKREVDLLLS